MRPTLFGVRAAVFYVVMLAAFYATHYSNLFFLLLAFLTLSETVLAPLWAWVGFAETPSPYTLAGGAVVLAAIVFETMRRIRPTRARRRTSD